MTSFIHYSALVVSTNGDGGVALEKLIAESPNFLVTAIRAEDIGKSKASDDLDIIVVDVTRMSEEEVDTFNALQEYYPEVPVVVVSEPLDSDGVHRLIKMRVHDWMLKPVDPGKLQTILQSAVRSAKAAQNRVHAVISTVGGAGATTIAVTLADVLANRVVKGSNVALFDLDFSTGNCGYVLNMMNSYDLKTVASNPGRIDAEFINLIQQQHDRKFFVYSFKRPDINTELDGFELVLRMLDAVSLQHEHTVLDIPYYETDWKSDVLSGVNTCTLVTEMNLPALKHCLDLVKRIRKLRGEDFELTIVVNKESRKLLGNRISRGKLKELFDETPIVFVPEDRDVIEESVDRGVLPSEVNRRSRFVRTVTSYVKTLNLGDKT